MTNPQPAPDAAHVPRERFLLALESFEAAPVFSRSRHVSRLLDTAERLLAQPGGAEAVYPHAGRLDAAGVFAGSDWDEPTRLQPAVVPRTLQQGSRQILTLEALSLLRFLAVAEHEHHRAGLSAGQAWHHLRAVLAVCLDWVFDRQTEAARARRGEDRAARNVLRFVAERIGHDDLLEQLVDEAWRLLRQRPIQVQAIHAMVTELAGFCYDPAREPVTVPAGAERLISALYGPSPASRGDPGLTVYGDRLAALDGRRLQEEAAACARAMHDTGLVSPYHAVLLRHLLREAPALLATALGLTSTGQDGFLTYRELVLALIEHAVHPETCQAIQGLCGLLERGTLHAPGVAASLWRQIKLPVCEVARTRLETAFGTARAPRVFLLAGAVNILGQPLGVGQGDNPTCQAARALSMWAVSDADYLLQLLAWAARDDEVRMSFQGAPISSAALPEGAAGRIGDDLDPVSLVLVPHLDRVYAEMGRRASALGAEDPHIHVNPEFHGWRVGRGFAIAVEVASGKLRDYEAFLRLFYGCFHPGFNGGQPVIHPQPVGLAVTDSRARFVGWHAITILRVALDAAGTVRVYFFNPNNDKGQDWGHGVVVSTEGHGELHGESSLPIAEFASRLYLFHYDPLEVGDGQAVPRAELEDVMDKGRASWAADRLPPD